MKNINKLMLPLATLLLISGCGHDNFYELSSADKQAYEKMETAFHNSEVYNDSLINHLESGTPGSPEKINYYDSMFHHHESLWNDYHNHYSHDEASGDHHHNGSGLFHHNHHHNHENLEGHHHEDDHELMEHLLEDHQPYHP